MAMAVEVPLPKRECPLLPPSPSSSSKSQSSPYTMPVTHGSHRGLVRDIIWVFNQSTSTSWKCKTNHKIAPNTLQSENELKLCWQTEREMSSLILQVIPSTSASHSLGTWQVGGGQVDGGRINTNTKPRDKYYNYHRGDKGPSQQWNSRVTHLLRICSILFSRPVIER